MTDPVDLDDLGTRVAELCLLQGQFVLRSGRTATHYFDKYRFESDPGLLAEIARAAAPLIPTGTEVLAGLEMGGIPVVTMLSQVTGLPACFVRKQAKAYGTERFAEGTDVDGRTVLVVEDVVTSGGQVVLSTADLRSIGARVTTAFCVIDRGEGGAEKLAEHDIELISLLRGDQLRGSARD